MRFNTLDSWLSWQQDLNPKTIDLGLDRVKQVYHRLNLSKIAGKVINVAGTNGKGSTVAYYETWFRNSGLRVASYTSPHLINYNERIKLNLQPVSNDRLCHAFAVIDDARGDVALTYFEFGTLAALYLISQFNPDIAILEVGLGGRLDAVNIIDADLAHITPIGLDHQDWLGKDVETIAFEKAGILRPQRLAVCNMPNPPQSLLNELTRNHCKTACFSRDYRYRPMDDGYIEWSGDHLQYKLVPPLTGNHQALNLSGVLAGLELLGYLPTVEKSDLCQAFENTDCPGRLQKIDNKFSLPLWVDVGHNEDAAQALAQAIPGLNCQGRVIVLLGMLADKNAAAFVASLQSVVDEWWVTGLDCARGLSALQLQQKIGKNITVEQNFDDIEMSIQHAVLSLNNQDILLVTGSFMTVEAVLSLI